MLTREKMSGIPSRNARFSELELAWKTDSNRAVEVELLPWPVRIVFIEID